MKRWALMAVGVVAVFVVQWIAAQLEDPMIEREWESSAKRCTRRYE